MCSDSCTTRRTKRFHSSLVLALLAIAFLAIGRPAWAATCQILNPSVTFNDPNDDEISYQISANWTTTGLYEEDWLEVHYTWYDGNGTQIATDSQRFPSSTDPNPPVTDTVTHYFNGSAHCRTYAPFGARIATYYYVVHARVTDGNTVYASDVWTSNEHQVNGLGDP